jgi:hypothetical protein
VVAELRPGAARRRGGGGGRGGGRGGRGAAAPPPPAAGPPPLDVATGYTVECVWRGTSYERMHAALRAFAADHTSVSASLYHAILGHDDAPAPKPAAPAAAAPRKLSAPGLPDLNTSQLEAVQRVLGQPLSLIQGPPGTGKTLTSATVVYHLARAGGGQVLVAAPSNIAVDHLAERVALTGLRVVRVQAKSREEVASPVEALTLAYQVRLGARGLGIGACGSGIGDWGGVWGEGCRPLQRVLGVVGGLGVVAWCRRCSHCDYAELVFHLLSFPPPPPPARPPPPQVRHLAVPEAAELRGLQQLRSELGELSVGDERKLRALQRALEKAVLGAADVVCATCVGAGDPRLASLRFRRVLIDEATQAVEPEALIPLVMGCKQAVLVGDHCQLGPVILNKAAARAGLCQSLFERLMLLGVRPIRLAVQVRCGRGGAVKVVVWGG